MKVVFSNITKNTLPLLVYTADNYEDYVKNLTTSSKRFLNLSYRKFNEEIAATLDSTILKKELQSVMTNQLTTGPITELIFTNLKNAKNKKPLSHFFIKYYEKETDKLIAFNHVGITYSDKKHGYCNCLIVLKTESGYDENRLFNTFSWFKFIELVHKSQLIDTMDLVVDTDLYNYIKLENGIEYNCEDIETSGKYINRRNITGTGFNNINSSKFLFLGKNDKQQTDKHIISVLCKCGHKTLLELYNKSNHCFNCKGCLSRLIT